MAKTIMFPAVIDQINEYARTGVEFLFRTNSLELEEQREQYRRYVFMVRSVAFVEKNPLPGVDKVVSATMNRWASHTKAVIACR